MQNKPKTPVTLDSLDHKTDQLHHKINSVEEALLEKIDDVEKRLNAKIDVKIDDLKEHLTIKLDKILEVVIDKQGTINHRLTRLEHHTTHPPHLAITD